MTTEITACRRGRPMMDLRPVLMMFATYPDELSYNHIRKLIDAGFIKLGECRKNPRGRPTNVYKLTSKGAGLNNILRINAERKAAKMAMEG